MMDEASMGPAFGLDLEVYGSREVSRLTGVSPRQLQWWDERGVVSPKKESHRRLYHRFEVVQVSLIVALRQKGLSLKKSRLVLDAFKQYVRQGGRAVLYRQRREKDRCLVTDGKKVYFAESPAETIEAVLAAQKPVIGISISSILRRVDGEDGIDDLKPVQNETRSSRPSNGRLPKTA